MSIKVLIDPGHGGSEAGATANGYIEKDLNLKVSLLLEEELKRCGFEVLMTRRTDTDLGVTERGTMANTLGVTCLISVHFNSYNGNARGTEIIYSYGNESAKWIANCIYSETEALGTGRRGVWTKQSDSYPGHNYYGVLRGAEPLAAVICEGLFLDNYQDIQFLKDANFLFNLAKAYAKGICAAYGIGYIEKVVEPVFDWKAKYKELKEQLKKLSEG